ncbi:MFS transporter [Methylobacterium sp. M6A4_1b]
MSLPSFAFSTQDVGPEYAFEAYSDLYSGGADVARIGPDFRAQVRAYRLDRMILFQRSLNGVQHSRSPQRVRQDGFDHVTLHLLLEGEMVAGPTGSARRVRPGEILVCDNTLPHQTRAHNVRQISTPVARDLIEPLVPDLRGFHGAILPEAFGGLVADFIVSLTRRSESLDSTVASRSSTVLGMLLGAALRGHAAHAEAVVWAAVHDAPDDVARRREAEALVERHLGDLDLGAETIAAQLSAASDRFLITRGTTPVKQDLALSDAQLGLLHGSAFVVLYALTMPLFGSLADRGHRRAILLASIGLWPLATLGFGLAGSFAALFLGRLAPGLGQAGLAPAALSLIAHGSESGRMARNVSLFTVGGSFGQSFALLAGGATLAWLVVQDGPFPGLGPLPPGERCSSSPACRTSR